ncbi:hypothetical protein EV385_0203 [Krasilnikovia cinnamomea]|uniref:Uncharacterized protein n=1 Tax=Krasilnikovia cinnamomea TaxID=349313 RepID=A0A4V2G6F1_9ACTN|nr:hypothetical protein [Krasilnikovia cinnamomea]RZU48486.1 hypothetical protein EV385_0203 [Krasilnikovia cinnamomea]
MINAEPGSDATGELREKIERAEARLASLNAQFPEYRELHRQVGRASVRLRERERAAARRAAEVRDARLFSLVPGGLVILAGWGSWMWILIGLGVALFGVWIADRLPDHLYSSGLGGETEPDAG